MSDVPVAMAVFYKAVFFGVVPLGILGILIRVLRGVPWLHILFVLYWFLQDICIRLI